jgi:hypothetical protein
MIINNPFNGRLNLDVADYRISNGDYIDALNITKDAEGQAQDKVISNILGNTEMVYTLPAGTNKVIGFYPDKIRNRAYYFLWNSNGFNTILYYDMNSSITVKVLESKTNSDGIDILSFDPSYKVLSVNIFYRDSEGDILYFNDGLNPPKSINVTANYGNSWKLEYLLIAKAPPIMPPQVVYENDTTVSVNNLRNSLYQFCYRFVYDNNEKSVWSGRSVVPLPQQPTLNLTENIISSNCRISISVSTGGADIKSLEFAFRENNNNNISDWYLIRQISKEENTIADNDIFTFKFYNDSIFSVIDVLETAQLQDYVPQKANASELANGDTLLYAGITEGYNKTAMNLLARNGTGLELFTWFADICGLLFFASCNGRNSGTSGTSLKICLYGTGSNINGEVTQLDNAAATYIINAASLAGVNIGISYDNTSSAIISVSTILTNVKNALIAKGWTFTSLSGNVLIMNFAAGFTLYSSGLKSNQTVGSPENTVYANAWDSGYQYALQYFDAQGRTIGAQTSILATFTTAKNNSTKFIQTFLEIKNRPPLEAVYYQVLRSNNTTYNKRLFWISNSAYRSYTSIPSISTVYDIESFAYIGIDNIEDYNKQFSSSVGIVNYSFTAGDRISFLKRYDELGVEKSIIVYDCEIIGTEGLINTSVGQKEGNFIKIKYPAAAVASDPTNFNFNGQAGFLNYQILLYNYSTNADVSQKTFYEFGKSFGIGNSGTSSAYHMGLEQTQSATNPATVPAIIGTTNGDLFWRKRKVIFDYEYFFNCGNNDMAAYVSSGLYTQIKIQPDTNKGSIYYSNANYQVGFQNYDDVYNDPIIIYPFDPTSYPTYSDYPLFWNKTSGTIGLKIKFDCRINYDVTGLNGQSSILLVFVTSTGEKTIRTIYAVKKTDATGDLYNVDSVVSVTPTTKVWMGAMGGSDGEFGFITSFNMTMNILQSKELQIIESSFNDFYNLTLNSNGRESVIDENAKKVYFPTLIRYSQSYQVNTNINGTNNFLFENYDEYDRSFGDVMRLHVRDRYLKVYQKFKVGNVPILTQIVKDVTGNPLQANTDQLINKIQYYAGDYGIGDASTSLAWNNFADYFVDNYRGVVCRLAQDGITPLSIIYSTNSFFASKLAAYRQDLNNGATADDSVYTGNPCIYGVFDAFTNKYIIAMEEINRYSDCIYNGGIALRTSYPTTTTTTSTTSTTTTTTSTTSTSTTTTTTTTAAPTTTTTTVVGFIQLINFGGFGSSIVSVEPSFFILTSGGLPVTSGMTSSGTQSGYTGNLGVTVSGASGLNLQLYVNSSLINSLPVTSDGIYTFVGVSIPNNVSVIIQLVNPA